MKYLKKIFTIACILSIATPSVACRFWVAVGEGGTSNAVNHLLIEPNSLKNLGSDYKDGWSIGLYLDNEPIIRRSALASNMDSEFDESVNWALKQNTDITFVHLRRASSGCVEGVPNPHPFKMERNGKTWVFGHNGGMKKQLLIDLIGEDYLIENPPIVCTESAPESWIDSELYFIYLMQSIEEHGWKFVEHGIQHGLLRLYRVIPEESHYLNFFLSDGETVWTFRKGTSLYYHHDFNAKQSYVSSTIPHAEPGDWQEFPENTIAVLSPNVKIRFIPLDELDD